MNYQDEFDPWTTSQCFIEEEQDLIFKVRRDTRGRYLSKTQLLNGKANGIRIDYCYDSCDDGGYQPFKIREFRYLNGKRNGKFKIWYPSSYLEHHDLKLRFEGNYSDDSVTDFREYQNDGTLIRHTCDPKDAEKYLRPYLFDI